VALLGVCWTTDWKRSGQRLASALVSLLVSLLSLLVLASFQHGPPSFFGVVGAAACNYGTKLKYLLGIDDALDIFAVHAIGGLVGNLLTGLFAADYIAHLDGYTVIPGGWINRNYIQLAYQLSDSVTGFAYSFVGSCIILLVMNFIPGLSLRSTEDDEIMGIDDAEIGEFAYDYVEITRDVVSGTDGFALSGFSKPSDVSSAIDRAEPVESKV